MHIFLSVILKQLEEKIEEKYYLFFLQTEIPDLQSIERFFFAQFTF